MSVVLEAPQLVTASRMLYFTWVPADPAAVRALVPDELELLPNSQCFINQYVVDTDEQTSAFEAYSLTYAGADLAGHDTPDGNVPGRWWTHYFNSSENMVRYATAQGVPAGAGTTTLELDGGRLVATSLVDGQPVIRTSARVEIGSPQRATGQLRYITRQSGELVSGRYPFVADLAENFEVESVEFLDAPHPVSALRPAEPLDVTFGFYSPSITFCYPGGQGPLGSEHGS